MKYSNSLEKIPKASDKLMLIVTYLIEKLISQFFLIRFMPVFIQRKITSIGMRPPLEQSTPTRVWITGLPKSRVQIIKTATKGLASRVSSGGGGWGVGGWGSLNTSMRLV